MSLSEQVDRLGVYTGQRNWLCDRAHLQIEAAAEQLNRDDLKPEDYKPIYEEAVVAIAAMRELLLDIGWDQDAAVGSCDIGATMPPMKLRAWIERWRREDLAALQACQQSLEVTELHQAEDREEDPGKLLAAEAVHRADISVHQHAISIALSIEAMILERGRG